MNWFQIIYRNAWFHRSSWLAVLSGVVISTMVLCGALILGDSVKFSLKKLTDVRLGRVRYANTVRDRFFRQDLARDLAEYSGLDVVSLLQSDGLAINPDKNLRINRVMIYGVDQGFSRMWDRPPLLPGKGEVVISENVASRLALLPGDFILVRISRPGKASRNAPFVATGASSQSLRLKVSVIADNDRMGRFSIKSNQSAPLNIFLSLDQMADLLDLSGLANLILTADPGKRINPSGYFDSLTRLVWKPEDAGLHIRPLATPGIFEITSDRIFIEDLTAKAIRESVTGSVSLLTWLANDLSCHGKHTPYSFVTAAPAVYLGTDPGRTGIIINEWLAADLEAKPGNQVMMKYFIPGPGRTLREDSTVFTVKSVVSLNDPVFDPGLMPSFPGLAGAGSCRSWETGAPLDLSRIRNKDEQYWQRYKGTPKAFISPEVAGELWANPFGTCTSVRFSAGPGTESVTGKTILDKLDPAAFGLDFQPVYGEGISAAVNSTDFSSLFMGLGFYIMIAGLLLSVLLLSFHLGNRTAETGLLDALGFRKKQIAGILTTEVLIIVLAGSVIGSFAGIAYTRLILEGLNTLWSDAVRTSLLEISIQPSTLIMGIVLGFLPAFSALALTLNRMIRQPVSLRIRRDFFYSKKGTPSRRSFHRIATLVLISSAVVLIVLSFTVTGSLTAILALCSGGLLLGGALEGLNTLLTRDRTQNPEPYPTLFLAAVRNAGLHRTRTMITAALLATGTFSIVITGANRKTVSGADESAGSGTGGFLFWAESSIPVHGDLNKHEIRDRYGLDDEPVLRDISFLHLREIGGDDASCLNLNQVNQPVILGVDPESLDRLKAFGFLSLLPWVDADHPWKALDQFCGQRVVPAFADQSVITWGLRRKTGDTLLYRTEHGESISVILAGGLENSIFQGNLLISDSLFRKYYPSVSGSKLILVRGPASKKDSVARRLEYLFRDYGMVLTPATERLAVFHSVENTYLSVFMILGGMGLLIGTAGLGTVIIRNIRERKRELALYQALGFHRAYISGLIFSEYAFILCYGFVTGCLAALAAIAPYFSTPGSSVPWGTLSVILFLVLANGFLWIWLPVRWVSKKNVMEVLRND